MNNLEILERIGLSQAQLAILLGISPQVVSRGMQSREFLRGRAQRLYDVISYIGGDRYELVASLLKKVTYEEWGDDLQYGGVENVSSADLYQNTEELWVLSDNPAEVLDYRVFKEIFFGNKEEKEPLIVFFVSSLEGAEQWAEFLERESIIDENFRVVPNKSLCTRSYIYIITVNVLPFSPNFLIGNPGSRCASRILASQSPDVFAWTGVAYVRLPNSSLASNFIRLAQQFGLGRSTEKVNFFPRAVPLGPDKLEFPLHFSDSILGIRGKGFEEAPNLADELTIGGILRITEGRQPNAIKTHQAAKIVPLFLMTYKKRPGDGPKDKSLNIVQREISGARSTDTNTKFAQEGSSKFDW
ncbi:MAG: helix-turn-helix transcriptional regulator [Candidatus Contendobacter sp.]|nr:helix-turn-helix transcriptional regulator [Candidatus Contendobacter sp.]